MSNVAGCSRNCVDSVRDREGLFDNQGRNTPIEILMQLRRAAISAQLPRHRLRVADGSGDKKFDTEEGADKALVFVKRTIGQKTGTGGSDGVKYLASTLFNPVFKDLWDIRSQF